MADRADATLLVQLAQYGTSLGIQEAMKTVLSDDFDPETASAQDAAVRTVLEFGETIGTLTKNGLLDTELVLDWLWVSGPWSRLEPAVFRAREKWGVPQMYENFQALAGQQM